MILYKYSPINAFPRASLAEHHLWFSPPSAFNDIDDSKLRLEHRYTDEDVRRELDFMLAQIYGAATARGDLSDDVGRLGSTAEQFFRQVLADRGPDGRPDHGRRLHAGVERALAERRTGIGISCFSREGGNQLLWAHYADAHRGVCLAVETDADGACFPQLEPVAYVDPLPKIKLLSHLGANVRQLYTTKSAIWSYEQEVRAFQHASGREFGPRVSLQQWTRDAEGEPAVGEVPP